MTQGLPSTSHPALPSCRRCGLVTACRGGVCGWCQDGRKRQPWEGGELAYKLLYGARYRASKRRPSRHVEREGEVA